jgi:hypothetical protein
MCFELVKFLLWMWMPLHLGIDVQDWDFLLVDFSFDEYEVSFPISFGNFWLKAYFIRYWNDNSSLFFGTIFLENFFPAFYSEVVSVFISEVCFLYVSECWILCLFIGNWFHLCWEILKKNDR